MYRLDTKEKRVQARESNLSFTKKLAGASYKEEVYKDLLFVTYEREVRGRGVKPFLQIYKGTQSSPYSNYYYVSVESRDATIAEAKKRADSRLKYDAERKAEKKAYERTLKVGDVLSASWGYEQTNIDFYQVVDVYGTKGVVIREIGATMVEATGRDQGIMQAVPDSFGDAEPMRKLEQKGGYVRIDSVRSASKSDGREWASWYY